MVEKPPHFDSSAPIEVLLVEDNPGDADLVRGSLSEWDRNQFEVTHVERLGDALACMRRRDYHVMLLDLSLPDGHGLQTLREARAAARTLPIVVMSGLDDESLALKAVQSGAQDYLVKGQVEPRALVRTLRHAMERQQMLMDLKRSREREHYLATRDPLTGLPNRQIFFDHLGQALAHAERGGRPLALMFLDVDRFKNINDSLGHAAGDQLLQMLALRLSSCLRVGDAAARLGGDEFTVLLSDFSRLQDVGRVASKMLLAIAEPCIVDNHELSVTASIGIALYPVDGRDYRALIRNADTAMYTAKERGRNSYQFYTPGMNALARERLVLEGSLRRALDREQLRVYYQPEVDVKSGQISGAEALLRWCLPGRGMLMPADFLPLAEETGLIVPIGEWVLREACEQNVSWRESGYPPIRVAVNLSSRQFRQCNLEAIVANVLRESGMEPDDLELEFSEGHMSPEHVPDSDTLKRLKEIGVRLAIDDFGTGYSSFSTLRTLPFDVVKIDQSFVRGAAVDARNAAIAEAMITMANSIGLESIAEGVETREQLEFLRSRKCDRVQGHLFSRAVRPDEFERRWRGFKRAAIR